MMEGSTPLKRATFEQPVEIFHHAAVKGLHDELNGVSEQLLIGKEPKCGSHFNGCVTEKDYQQKWDEEHWEPPVEVDDSVGADDWVPTQSSNATDLPDSSWDTHTTYATKRPKTSEYVPLSLMQPQEPQGPAWMQPQESQGPAWMQPQESQGPAWMQSQESQGPAWMQSQNRHGQSLRIRHIHRIRPHRRHTRLHRRHTLPHRRHTHQRHRHTRQVQRDTLPHLQLTPQHLQVIRQRRRLIHQVQRDTHPHLQLTHRHHLDILQHLQLTRRHRLVTHLHPRHTPRLRRHTRRPYPRQKLE